MEQLDLSYFCKTKAEATDFSTRLATISQKIFQTDFSLQMALLDQFGILKRDKFLSLLRDNNINLASSSAIQEFIAKIQAKIASLPIIKLVLAFEPKEQTMEIVSQWFILNVNKQFLFDICVDTQLIAGASITFNSKMIDCSLKPQFEEIIKDTLTSLSTTPPTNFTKPISGVSVHQDIDHIDIGR